MRGLKLRFDTWVNKATERTGAYFSNPGAKWEHTTAELRTGLNAAGGALRWILSVMGTLGGIQKGRVSQQSITVEGEGAVRERGFIVLVGTMNREGQE